MGFLRRIAGKNNVDKAGIPGNHPLHPLKLLNFSGTLKEKLAKME